MPAGRHARTHRLVVPQHVHVGEDLGVVDSWDGHLPGQHARGQHHTVEALADQVRLL